MPKLLVLWKRHFGIHLCFSSMQIRNRNFYRALQANKSMVETRGMSEKNEGFCKFLYNARYPLQKQTPVFPPFYLSVFAVTQDNFEPKWQYSIVIFFLVL
jgi:hypothetical protein